MQMDRYWLLTSTTYGTWLPGDFRGFVSNVRDVGANDQGADAPRSPAREVRHNVPGTPYDADLPGLERSARSALKRSANLS